MFKLQQQFNQSNKIHGEIMRTKNDLLLKAQFIKEAHISMTIKAKSYKLRKE